MYEYEVKLLGDFDSLANVFNSVAPETTPTTNEFDTVYLDDKFLTLRNQGFCLRYRPANPIHAANIELKGICGSEGGVSKRIEICERGDDASFDELLQRLRKKVEIVTIPDNLRDIFTITTLRSEKLYQPSLGLVVEVALDKVQFKHRQKVVGADSELELELKEFPKSYNPEQAVLLVAPHLSEKVRLSTQSKYSRMLELING